MGVPEIALFFARCAVINPSERSTGHSKVLAVRADRRVDDAVGGLDAALGQASLSKPMAWDHAVALCWAAYLPAAVLRGTTIAIINGKGVKLLTRHLIRPVR